MKSHSEIRGLLALAAAGALEARDVAIVKAHAAECEECRRELEVLNLYSTALSEIPAPAVPVGLLERTQAQLLANESSGVEQRVQTWWLTGLAVFSWIAALSFWWVVRIAAGGEWRVLGVNLANAFLWSLASTLLTWATAGAVAVLLGRNRGGMRNVL